MRKIRVLIVDDSIVVRHVITDMLHSDPNIEVAGTAVNGHNALTKIIQVNPDLVTLDLEMPEMNGLEALAVIRKAWPKLPVIMFSTFTERGAEATLEALALGATDYVTKPDNMSMSMQRIRESLIPKIKTFCACSGNFEIPPEVVPARTPVPETGHVRPSSTSTGATVEIVAIGVSTGGPNALASLIPSLPSNLPVPVVIVQHMPPIFTRLLAERLASKSSLAVREGARGDRLEPGTVWIAPGDFHMVLERDKGGVCIGTQQEPHENSCRPAVDVLFRSVAGIYQAHTLGIILTGMGQDGLRGCELIRENGGQILAQDEATSVVWGMPGFVAKAGLADRVMPLDHIGNEIVRRVNAGRFAGEVVRPRGVGSRSDHC